MLKNSGLWSRRTLPWTALLKVTWMQQWEKVSSPFRVQQLVWWIQMLFLTILVSLFVDKALPFSIKWVNMNPLRRVYLLLRESLWNCYNQKRICGLKRDRGVEVLSAGDLWVSCGAFTFPARVKRKQARLQNNFPSLILRPEKWDRKLTILPDHQWMADG